MERKKAKKEHLYLKNKIIKKSERREIDEGKEKKNVNKKRKEKGSVWDEDESM